MREHDLYAAVEHALGALGCDIGAAECHGVLCGMLCGAPLFDRRVWLAHLAGGEAVAPLDDGDAGEALGTLEAHTLRALDGDEYSFALVLPADDEPLALRAAAFADWCRGFLSGLGLAGIADTAALGEDARDFVRDLARFGAIEVAQDPGEDDERAFAELTEFTRLGALIVYAERDARTGHEPAAPGVH
jgi:uncharacterized protein